MPGKYKWNGAVTFRGESRPIGEWAERLGIKRHTLYFRLNNGWMVERAFTELARKRTPAVSINRRAKKRDVPDALPARVDSPAVQALNDALPTFPGKERVGLDSLPTPVPFIPEVVPERETAAGAARGRRLHLERLLEVDVAMARLTAERAQILAALAG